MVNWLFSTDGNYTPAVIVLFATLAVLFERVPIMIYLNFIRMSFVLVLEFAFWNFADWIFNLVLSSVIVLCFRFKSFYGFCI